MFCFLFDFQLFFLSFFIAHSRSVRHRNQVVAEKSGKQNAYFALETETSAQRLRFHLFARQKLRFRSFSLNDERNIGKYLRSVNCCYYLKTKLAALRFITISCLLVQLKYREFKRFSKCSCARVNKNGTS